MKACDQIDCWKLFIALTQLGSIQKAAERCQCDSAEISRKLSKLEKELKFPLLDRSSRPFRLTQAGAEILPLVEDMLDRHAEILEIAEQKTDKDRAVIRMMIPDTFAKISHSLFFEYSKYFSGHRIQAICPVNTENFRRGAADIAAVTGNVNMPEAVLIPRGRMLFIPAASPKFLKKYGRIDDPSRLAEVPVGHTFAGDRNSFTPFNSLIRGGERRSITLNMPIQWTSMSLIYEAVLAGDCVSPGFPLFYIIDDLKAGRLVPILDGWHRASQVNYLACHRSRWNVSYVRIFMNWFAEKFAEKEAGYEKDFADLFGEELLHEYMTS